MFFQKLLVKDFYQDNQSCHPLSNGTLIALQLLLLCVLHFLLHYLIFFLNAGVDRGQCLKIGVRRVALMQGEQTIHPQMVVLPILANLPLLTIVQILISSVR